MECNQKYEEHTVHDKMNDHTVEDADLTLEGVIGPMVCEEDRLEECMNMDENEHYSKENTILTPMCEHAVCEKNDHTVMTRMKNRGKLKFREYCAECDMGDETMIGEEGRLCLSLLFAVKAEKLLARSAQPKASIVVTSTAARH
jgi:hypothetical protein